MREFKFQKKAEVPDTIKGKASNAISEALSGIEPDDVFQNLHSLLKEIDYSTKQSVEKAHPYLTNLSAACKNVGAFTACLPVLLKDNKMGSILSNPEILLHVPSVNIRELGNHFSTIIDAVKLYLGTHQTETSNVDIAKQFFSLMSNIISPSDDRGVIERIGKDFARIVNDGLHHLVPVDGNGNVIVKGEPVINETKTDE